MTINKAEVEKEMLEIARWNRALPLADTPSRAIEKDDSQIEELTVCDKFSDAEARQTNCGLPSRSISDCGMQLARKREILRLNKIVSCPNRHYAGGQSHNCVSDVLSTNLLLKVEHDLNENRANKFTTVISPEPPSSPAKLQQPFYFAFVHKYQLRDVYDLPDFVHSVQSNHLTLGKQIGFWENFLFFECDEIQPYFGEGADLSKNEEVESKDGKKIDVFPVIVTSRAAWTGSYVPDARCVDVSFIPHDRCEKSYPTGSFGFLTAKFNDAISTPRFERMAIIESAVTYYGAPRK